MSHVIPIVVEDYSPDNPSSIMKSPQSTGITSKLTKTKSHHNNNNNHIQFHDESMPE